MTAEVLLATGVVDTVKVVLDCPGAILTEVGTVALAELLDKLIVVPEGPAGPVKLMVPVALEPPWTDVGARVSVSKLGGVTVRVWVNAFAP